MSRFVCPEDMVCYTLEEAKDNCLGDGDNCTILATLAFGSGVLVTILALAFAGWISAKYASFLRRQ